MKMLQQCVVLVLLGWTVCVVSSCVDRNATTSNATYIWESDGGLTCASITTDHATLAEMASAIASIPEEFSISQALAISASDVSGDRNSDGALMAFIKAALPVLKLTNQCEDLLGPVDNAGQVWNLGTEHLTAEQVIKPLSVL